jgi:rare lipoprotein A
MTSLVAACKSWRIALVAALWLAGCSAANRASLSPSLPGEHSEYRAPASGHLTLASWYGPGFIGKRTASGETYHEDDLTAASRSLPLGTRVQVTNLDNGRSVIVRINDHGPFVRGRGIDLSERAAKDIGLNHSGIARVSVTRLDATASAAAPTSVPPQWRGVARITHSTGSRYLEARHTRHHYYRYASTSTYHRTHRIVGDPVGDWLFQMVR